MTERELLTISETIASQEMAMQQRYAAACMRLLTASDAELPTYEEIARVLEEEKRRAEEKMKTETPPPSYSRIVMQESYSNQMPNIV